MRVEPPVLGGKRRPDQESGLFPEVDPFRVCALTGGPELPEDGSFAGQHAERLVAFKPLRRDRPGQEEGQAGCGRSCRRPRGQ
ncbi:MAG TPA: hypothetical protein PK307_16680 [Spirochaetota bacterium]|nr:hypothetical protein [Spirochaetota bacterium]